MSRHHHVVIFIVVIVGVVVIFMVPVLIHIILIVNIIPNIFMTFNTQLYCWWKMMEVILHHLACIKHCK